MHTSTGKDTLRPQRDGRPRLTYSSRRAQSARLRAERSFAVGGGNDVLEAIALPWDWAIDERVTRFRFGGLEFSWDQRKATANAKKHRVTFEEAATVFADPLARLYDDPDHSDEEPRFLLVGYSFASRVLWWCMRRIAIQFASSVLDERSPANAKTTMRSEYHLKNGRANPYAARMGAKGRAELLEWWSRATTNVRLLPDDVARAFPDTETTVEALRLVIKLRNLRSTRDHKGAGTRRARRAKRGAT